MIEWGLSSAVLAGLFIVLRYALRGRIGLRIQYALWGLVLLRLLVPVSFGSSAVSIMNVLPGQRTPFAVPDPVPVTWTSAVGSPASPSVPPGSAGEVNDGAAFSDGAGRATDSPVREAPAFPAAAPDMGRILFLIWIIGACLVFLWFLGVNTRFALRLRRGRRPLAVSADYPLPVFAARETETSCLFGIIHPAVYLAQGVEEEPCLDYILAHEFTHYRHGDHVWSLLRGAALALHWYDPLVWWAAALSRRDGELACDEGTLHRLGEGERAEYGHALLRMTSVRRPFLFRSGTAMTGSNRGLKERVRFIARRPRTTVLAVISVLLIAVPALGCTFTGANRAKTATPAPRLAEDGRIVLTVGAFQKDSSLNAENDQLSFVRLKKAVDRFNGENKEYLLEIRNYGDAACAEDLARLNSEVETGNMPDLLVTCGMPEGSYAQKGLLLDLSQWYDREQFFAGPLKSMETGGRLFSVSSSFEVFSFYGLESELGRAEGYDLAALYESWESFYTGENAFIPRFNGFSAFLVLTALRMGEWVDAASGSCRFDSPEFLSLLEFCQKLPAEAAVTDSELSDQGRLTWDKMNALCVKNKDALLGWVHIAGDVGSVVAQYAYALTPLEGERIVNVGLPGMSPAAAGCIPELPVAVSARCGSPEGARAFLDSLWDLKYLQAHEGELRSIPLMRSVLEDHIRKNTYVDEAGEAYAAFLVGPSSRPCTDALIGDFLALVEGADVPLSLNSLGSVDPIILEEVAACFGDAQSAEETAANIQARYKRYFAEQDPS